MFFSDTLVLELNFNENVTANEVAELAAALEWYEPEKPVHITKTTEGEISLKAEFKGRKKVKHLKRLLERTLPVGKTKTVFK